MPLTAQQLIDKSRISIALDTYDDIFSDFDPRPYTIRTLSDDFLLEAKKAVREKDEKFELRFLIPAKSRRPQDEALITKRLHDHFHAQAVASVQHRRGLIRKGILASCAGFGLILIATSIHEEDFWSRLATVILEPSGWFSMWYGFDTLIYNTKEHRPEHDFNKRMRHASVIFEPY